MRRKYRRQELKRKPKHLFVGIGGTTCVCCFPAPGSKARKHAFRCAKRAASREAFRIEDQNIETP